MKGRKVIFIIVIFFLLLMFYKMKNQPIEAAFLFPNEEITNTNIESIEILKIRPNANVVIDDKVGIEKISDFLMKLNADNIDENTDDNIDGPIYHIYIANIGRYPHAPISVFEDSIVYNGQKRDMTSEESSSLIQLLDGEFRK